jgi:serine phosphatase RsbU (regulator of sigma subunit)
VLDESSGDFRFAYANQAYERLAPSDRVVGSTLGEVWPAGEPDADTVRRVADTGELWTQRYVLAGQPDDDGVRPYGRLLTRVMQDEQSYVVDIVVHSTMPMVPSADTTPGKRMGAWRDRMALISRIASMASSSLALETVCERTLSGICERIADLSSGGIYVTRDDGTLRALAVYERDRPVHMPDEDEHVTPSTGVLAVAEQRYQLLTYESAAHPMTAAAPEPSGRRIDLAIERRGTLLGVLELGFEGAGSFDQDEIRMYHAIASILGNAVGNARSHQDQVRNTRIAHGLSIVLDASMRSSSEEQLGRECLEVLAGLTGSTRGFMATLQPDGSLREAAIYAAEEPDSESGMAEASGRAWPIISLWEAVLAAGETMILRDPVQHVEDMPEGHPRVEAAMITPLIGKQGQAFGIVILGNRPGGYGGTERATVEALVPAIVESVERFRAERELAENARLADELNHIESIVHASLDVNTIAEEALRTGLEALKADSAALSLYEPPNFRPTHAIGFSRDICSQPIPEDFEPHSQLAIRTKAPVLIEDAATDERVQYAHLLAHDIHAVMVLPLLVGGKAFGNVYYNFTRPRTFSSAEVQFAVRLSLSLSLAMENARLYETERTISNRLQEALLALPDSVHGVDFAHAYYPATDAAKVGGDFYDLFELSYGFVGITIGDVAGKGIDAAALTSLVKNTIRAHASERGKTPAQILQLTNEVLYKTTPVESFVTVFFGLLDCRDGRMVSANGGHTTAAIVRGDGEIVKLPVTGPLLGALPEIELEHAETSLEPEDTLFLYTDGLTEARHGGELYGEDRLFVALADAPERRPRKLMQRVVADVMAYSRGVLRDDLALLVVRRSTKGPQAPHQEKLRV